MPLICTHCQRTNSAEARYCYHDGASLLGAAHPVPLAGKTFAAPFVFPSGHACRDYDEFAIGCQREWEVAADMLRKGFFQQFFSGLGRMDLGQLAKEAAGFPDRDRGLDQFLARLPSKSVPAARLDVQPKLINLGTLRPGVNSAIELRLENKGARLIFGSLSSSSDWLVVGAKGEAKLFQFRDSATIVVQVKGQHLRAGLKQLEGDLFVESNAGTFRLKVIASVPIQAFPHGCLAGAKTPRELAELAKKHSKEAGALFESGAVAEWYRGNGWTYPVQGPASTGMAAVQQFFEALGLSKPPKVFIAEPKLTLKGEPGTKVTKHIQVRSDEARPVFAYATSSAGWCLVKPAVMQGNLVTLPIEIAVPQHAGETAQTLVRVMSNGQQRFDVPIHVTAEKGTASASPFELPRDDVSVLPRTMTPTSDSGNLAKHLIPLFALGFVLLILFAKDVISGATQAQNIVKDETIDGKNLQQAGFKVDIQDEPDEGVNLGGKLFKIDDEPEERFGPAPKAPVKVEIKDEPEEGGSKSKGAIPIDPTPRIAYQYDGNKRWGLTDVSTGKRLTFSHVGDTNTTIVRVAGQSASFGGIGGGDFRKLPDDPNGEGRKGTSHSYFIRPGLRVTQILQIVPSKQPVEVAGKQRRLLDTLLVRYLFENTGQKAFNAGLRLEVDTLIGNNDGVPFTVPGRGLVNTSADFTTADTVPDFVQALETGSLRNPGTVVHISLKVGGGIEAPTRATLCHWNTNGNLSNIRATNMGNDSAIVLTWPDKDLQPGERRDMGYAYGLGTVTAADGGTLAVTLGGNFDIGQSFTITAYVNKPAAGQTLTLEMPAGLERIKGEPTQNVAAPTAGTDTSIVSWEAKVQSTGVFPVKVRSSTGVTQTKTITIARGDAPTGGKLSLDLQGAFEPGQEFTVVGKVTDPLANQTLTIQVPDGLKLVKGAEKQTVPAPPAGSPDVTVQWQVRVVNPGKYPVRVASSTGVAQTKTITIVQSARAEGAFQILLTGAEFAPGKTFTVSTKVVNPVPDQKLTLVLPSGLQRVDGAETQTPAADVTLAWKVKIDQVGKFSVGVKSTTGVTQRKSLIIEPPSESPGRFDFKLTGDIRPGREFQVIATVTNPTVGQTLTLVLPPGLELAKGPPQQPAAGSIPLTWDVRVLDSGRLPIRIESSTGLTRTKTVTISKSGVF